MGLHDATADRETEAQAARSADLGDPTFSGLVQSTNYYPISHQKREEGAAYLALGLNPPAREPDTLPLLNDAPTGI